MDLGRTACAIRAEGWLQLEDPSMTMAEAEAVLRSLGNTIIEVDHEGRRFKVMDTVSELLPGGLDNAPADWPGRQGIGQGNNAVIQAGGGGGGGGAVVTRRRWTDEQGQEWVCAARDHGPLCHRCQPVPAETTGETP